MNYCFIPFEKKTFLSEAFDQSKCRYIGIPNLYQSNRILFKKKSVFDKIRLFSRKAALTCRIIQQTHPGDVTIFWQNNYAMPFSMINHYFRLKRKVLVVNFLDYSVGIKARLKALIFNPVFQSDSFFLTVNSLEHFAASDRYNFKGKPILELQDCVIYQHLDEKPFSLGNGSILCAGNIRDWPLLHRLAKRLPQYTFVCVAGSSKYPFAEDGADCPANLKLLLDLPIPEFLKLLEECSLSLVAVPSAVPNGITLVYQSAILHRPILATDTPALRKLLNGEQEEANCAEFYPMGDEEEAARKIIRMMENPSLRQELSENAVKLYHEHSPERFSAQIYNYIREVVLSDSSDDR